MEKETKIVIGISVLVVIIILSYFLVVPRYNQAQRIIGYNQAQSEIIMEINTNYRIPVMSNITGNLTIEWISLCSAPIKNLCGW